jgi:glutamate racemase
MIEPGSKLAVEKTKGGKIGVIGTRATIGNHAYSREIKSLDPSLEVFEKACPLFVPLAEEGWTRHKATYDIAEEYLTELKDLKIDTLVLGCTHYPILADVIQDVIGKDVVLIDSGVASAQVVKDELNRLNLLNYVDNSGRKGWEFFVSDIPVKFKEVARLFLGWPVKDVQKVELESLIL